MAIPKLIDESARLKTYSKKVYGSPPMKGIHFGHIQEAIGNCNISTTCPKKMEHTHPQGEMLPLAHSYVKR